jgi:hypothetical protein
MITECDGTSTAELKGVKLTREFIDKFMSLIDKNGPVPGHMPHLGNCWIWRGSRLAKGYGRIHFSGKHNKAHRAAWTIFHGTIPDGMLVLHKCDNPLCVRGGEDGHLFLGSHQDNADDMTSKKRQHGGDEHWMRKYPERVWIGKWVKANPDKLARGKTHFSVLHPEQVLRGEQSGQAKLTDADVLSIRSEFAAGGTTRMELAIKYNMGWSQIDRIVRRASWKHVA